MANPVIIGDATLYLGDAREYHPRCGAVVTDPPYGMSFRSNYRVDRYAPIANDNNAELIKWDCHLPADHSRYVFARWDCLQELPKPTSVITWVKNNWSMGDLEHAHARQTEICLYWPGEAHKWPHKRPTDVIRASRTGNDEHPTEKPVYLMETIVKWTEGVVYDPFMGSGTTGVACANLGRRFIGIEIERKYFDIACERIAAAYAQGRLFA